MKIEEKWTFNFKKYTKSTNYAPPSVTHTQASNYENTHIIQKAFIISVATPERAIGNIDQKNDNVSFFFNFVKFQMRF